MYGTPDNHNILHVSAEVMFSIQAVFQIGSFAFVYCSCSHVCLRSYTYVLLASL